MSRMNYFFWAPQECQEEFNFVSANHDVGSVQYFLNMPDYAHVPPFMIAPVTPSTGTHVLLDFEK